MGLGPLLHCSRTIRLDITIACGDPTTPIGTWHMTIGTLSKTAKQGWRPKKTSCLSASPDHYLKTGCPTFHDSPGLGSCRQTGRRNLGGVFVGTTITAVHRHVQVNGLGLMTASINARVVSLLLKEADQDKLHFQNLSELVKSYWCSGKTSRVIREHAHAHAVKVLLDHQLSPSYEPPLQSSFWSNNQPNRTTASIGVKSNHAAVTLASFLTTKYCQRKYLSFG